MRHPRLRHPRLLLLVASFAASSPLAAQLPKVEGALYGGVSRLGSIKGSTGSKYDSLDPGVHLGAAIQIRLGEHLALRAGARRQSHAMRPTSATDATGTYTFSGSGVFFTTSAGPLVSFSLTPRLRAQAFAGLSRVYDKSRLTCRQGQAAVFCAGSNSDDSGHDLGLGLRYRLGSFHVLGEYRRESFSATSARATLGFNSLSVGLTR